MSKRVLFFIVHPSKYHLFRNTINALIERGVNVDVVITGKDVLPELVSNETWNTTNLFPNGRRVRVPLALVKKLFMIGSTIVRLLWLTRKQAYDLVITDDLAVWVARIRGWKSVAFCDDDIDVVPEFALVLFGANYILAPQVTRMGRFATKVVPFDSYKELAYLHPAVFDPKVSVLQGLNLSPERYVVFRLVELAAYHDRGKKGLSDSQVERLIFEIKQAGFKVVISSERALPQKYEKYRIDCSPADFIHVLAFARLFVGDSQTMTSEAAVLGVPAFRCNDFYDSISVMNQKDLEGLSYSFRVTDYETLIVEVQRHLGNINSLASQRRRRNQMLENKHDANLSKYLLKTIVQLM